MRLLLVEDDLGAGHSVLKALQKADFSVDWVRDGKAGSVAMNAEYYAAVLLDFGLPCIDGMHVLKAARAAGNMVPVLMLAEHDDPETRADSLDSGADDCLLKPLDLRELLARIRAVLRRRAGAATSRIGDASMSLDLERRTLTQHGVESALSLREFALIHAFMERPGAILSRDQLEQRIYGWGKEVESNAVDVLIHSVRKKFGRSMISNVRGMGWTVAGRRASPSMRN